VPADDATATSPRIEADLGVVADLADDVWHDAERYGRSIELSAALVGKDDRVDAERGDAPRVSSVWSP
jgi:hypothetical protein